MSIFIRKTGNRNVSLSMKTEKSLESSENPEVEKHSDPGSYGLLE